MLFCAPFHQLPSDSLWICGKDLYVATGGLWEHLLGHGGEGVGSLIIS